MRFPLTISAGALHKISIKERERKKERKMRGKLKIKTIFSKTNSNSLPYDFYSLMVNLILI